MTEPLFEFTYGTAVQSYMACGNFLCERFGPGTIASAALKVKWPVHALYIHCEGHEIATLQEHLHWSGGGQGNAASIHPRCILDPMFAEQMLSLMFDEFLRRSSRSMSIGQRRGHHEYQIVADLRQIIENDDRRQELVCEFSSAIMTDSNAVSDPVVSIKCGRDHARDLPTSDAVETLCQWASYSPLYLPALNASAFDPTFLMPRLVLEGRRRKVMEDLRSCDDPRAALAIRELNRLREMPRVALRLARRHPEWEPYVTTVRRNLDWLTGAA